MTGRVLVVEHERTAGAGLIAEQAARRDLDVVTVGPDAGAAVPSGSAGYDGVVVLGGSMGPSDDEVAGWLSETRSLIRDCVQRGTPLLGTCLGAQLMAVALGGAVEPAPVPEVGLGPLRLTTEASVDALFGGLAGQPMTLHWHWLRVSELPAGAALLASSPLSPVQAFRLGPRAWATQFHLEAMAATARTWADEMGDQLCASSLDADHICRRWEAAASEVTRTWATVIDRWLDLLPPSSS